MAGAQPYARQVYRGDPGDTDVPPVFAPFLLGKPSAILKKNFDLSIAFKGRQQ